MLAPLFTCLFSVPNLYSLISFYLPVFFGGEGIHEMEWQRLGLWEYRCPTILFICFLHGLFHDIDTNARSSKFSREKAFTQEVATPPVVAPVDVNPSVEETVEVEDEETRRLREIQELEDEYETMSKKQAELEKRMEALLSSLKKVIFCI